MVNGKIVRRMVITPGTSSGKWHLLSGCPGAGASPYSDFPHSQPLSSFPLHDHGLALMAWVTLNKSHLFSGPLSSSNTPRLGRAVRPPDEPDPGVPAQCGQWLGPRDGPAPAQCGMRYLEGESGKPRKAEGTPPLHREHPQTLPRQRRLEGWTTLMYKQVADLRTPWFSCPAPKGAEEQPWRRAALCPCLEPVGHSSTRHCRAQMPPLTTAYWTVSEWPPDPNAFHNLKPWEGKRRAVLPGEWAVCSLPWHLGDLVPHFSSRA